MVPVYLIIKSWSNNRHLIRGISPQLQVNHPSPSYFNLWCMLWFSLGKVWFIKSPARLDFPTGYRNWCWRKLFFVCGREGINLGPLFIWCVNTLNLNLSFDKIQLFNNIIFIIYFVYKKRTVIYYRIKRQNY